MKSSIIELDFIHHDKNNSEGMVRPLFVRPLFVEFCGFFLHTSNALS